MIQSCDCKFKIKQNFFNKFDLHKSGANKMTKIRRPELNRDSYLKSLDKFANKRTLLPRAPTPPQIGGDVVDDADNMDYRFEQVRLNSFQNWPIPYISPADLAAAGFYYTKHLDRVKCFECSTEICKWEEGDNPNTEHQRWGARCRFIRKLSCGNVPIGVDPRTVPLPRARSFDVCGPYGLEYRLDAEADTHTASSTSGPGTSNKARHSMENTQLPSAAMLGCFGIGITRRPDFPEYASYEARLQSFEQWPTAIVQTKEQLADAGFFYTNVGDQTTCYHCGGGLKNWEPQDDPWVQHAKWFSKCFYVLLVKGQEFINSVTGKNVPPLSEEDTKKMNLPSCIKKVEVVVPQKEKNENNQVVNSEEICNTNATETLVKEVNKESIAPSCSTLKESQGKPLDDARVCKICYNDELGVVFLPCGHIVACVKCALGMTTCAVCRKSVTMTARAFFS